MNTELLCSNGLICSLWINVMIRRYLPMHGEAGE